MSRMQLAHIELDPKQIADVRATLKDSPAAFTRVLRGAIKRTGMTIKARTLDAVTANLNIKRRDINLGPGNRGHRFGGVRFSQPGNEALSGTVSVTGKRIPLYRFAARELGTKKNPKGVTYKIDKDGNRKKVWAFIASTKSGHTAVFMRMGKPRYPINEYYGPSIPQVAQHRPEMKRMLAFDASDILTKNVNSQLQFVLARRRTRNG